jgi:hypothetical protein
MMSPQKVIFSILLYFGIGVICPVIITAAAEPATARENVFEIGNKTPRLQIPVSMDLLTNQPDVLMIQISEVINTNMSPITMSLYFEASDVRRKIGSFTLYPPDHPGTFKLRMNSNLLQEMIRTAKENKRGLMLCIEMQSGGENLHPGTPPSSITVRMNAPAFLKLNP